MSLARPCGAGCENWVHWAGAEADRPPGHLIALSPAGPGPGPAAALLLPVAVLGNGYSAGMFFSFLFSFFLSEKKPTSLSSFALLLFYGASIYRLWIWKKTTGPK